MPTCRSIQLELFLHNSFGIAVDILLQMHAASGLINA